MNKANSKSDSKSREALLAATLEEIVRVTGKDPLVAFAEAACGMLECPACNGAGRVGDPRKTCKRCQGTGREKVPPATMVNARYKLATFFYGPRKATEAADREGQGEPPERFLTVRFTGPDGEPDPDLG